MSMFDKLFKKYDVNPEENDPVELYGVPFPNEENEQSEDLVDDEKKYNVIPDNNIPEMLYGVPNINGQISPLGADVISEMYMNFVENNNDEISQTNDEIVEEYTINPEDNNPTKLYGVPNFRYSVMKNIENMKNDDEKDENI